MRSPGSAESGLAAPALAGSFPAELPKARFGGQRRLKVTGDDYQFSGGLG
jgi:hypothetical protein